MNPFAITYLNGLRFLSALVVVLGHIHDLFFVGIPAQPTLYAKLFYSVSARSYDAVMVFFVLSGLLVTQSAAKTFATETETWRDYAIARMSRLYVVLIPALLLGMFWDGLGLHQFGATYRIAEIPVAERYHATNFFGTLFFLQEIAVNAFGSNQPLWSLAYEAWYYLMFPLVFTLCNHNAATQKRWVCAALLGICMVMTGSKITGYFLLWLMGSALYFLPRRLPKARLAAPAVLLATGIGTVAMIFLARKILFVGNPVGWAADMLVGICITAHLYVVLQYKAQPYRAIMALSKRGADMSFTLYLGHFPVLIFLVHTLGKGEPWQPDVAHLAMASGLVVGIVLYCAFVARVTEAHTPKVRRWLMARWG